MQRPTVPIALIVALALASSFALVSPPSVYAHSLESCAYSTHDSSTIKTKALIDHTYGKGFVRAGPWWAQCDDVTWVATNVTDVHLESWVDELQSGNWVSCAYTDQGWRGSAPGSGEWFETWNYYYMQSCGTGYYHRTRALGIGQFQDGHQVYVWAYSPSHN
ncbi:MAG: hypothetical protein HYY01_05410 [Chloroflexi bacterium]|nr:hypothetical protein [Chloroflexota bacterium]